jgi:diguanylate cyclase (GGDEF)-like protein
VAGGLRRGRRWWLTDAANGRTLEHILRDDRTPVIEQHEPTLRALRDGRDPLTGVLGRDRLHEEVGRAVAAASRFGEEAAVCVIGLDNLREVNAVHGHGTGDRLLAAAAAAMTSRLRTTDTLGRLGADEFAAVLPRTGADAARAVAAELLDAVRTRARVALQPEELRITASAGVAVTAPERAVAAAELLAEADSAMLAAKRAGRDRVALAEAGTGAAEQARDRLSWAARIRNALEDDGLELHAQPIVPLSRTADPAERYELLVRLRGSDAGPAEFLATAERFGQIQAIDGWVVTHAVDLLSRTRGTVLQVNLAPASIGDADLTGFIERAIRAGAIEPRRLVFEITETAAIADPAGVRAALDRLRALGCAMALDDFGAGFASFAYLKQLPFDMLKIDGQFVRDLRTSLVDRLAVGAMATVARGLGMCTVGEYAGDSDTLSLLRALGIDHAQGFHVGRPKPVDDLWP